MRFPQHRSARLRAAIRGRPRHRVISNTRFPCRPRWTAEWRSDHSSQRSALTAAHALGLVHRDLKPENIFLQRHASGTVAKVLDFGLAKALNAAPGSTTIATAAGLLVGTVEYMAPEQLAGGDVSPGWDMWAVAIIAHEMLTGVHPFRRAARLKPDAARGKPKPCRTASRRCLRI
ncbi:MAG: protein kinase domain-containing protein [Gemmatimonadaceae bacterium]